MELRKDQKDKVDKRLLAWAAASVGGGGLVGTLGSSAMYDHVPNDFEFKILWSPEIEETEQAVRSLKEPERDVIKEHYLRMDSTLTQSCRHLGISSSQYYRRRDAGMCLIYMAFEENKRRCANF